MKTLKNDPAKAGCLAARKVTFGELSRYAVAPVHTRFDAVQWFVWDVEQLDPSTELPAIIRQADDLQTALAGLPVLGAQRDQLARRFRVQL